MGRALADRREKRKEYGIFGMWDLRI
jgi:hypothetical protein